MVVVAYDIPEENRRARRQLARQLSRWGFVVVQKSVWQSNDYLPMGFEKFINENGLRDSVRVYFTSQTKSQA